MTIEREAEKVETTPNARPHVPADAVPDPGLPEHHYRPTDVSPAAAKRAERQIASLFGLSMLSSVLFVVAYVTLEVGDSQDTFLNLGASNLALGLTLGGAMLFLGIGIIQWGAQAHGRPRDR